MDTLLLLIVACLGYLIAYKTNERFLAKKIFKLQPQTTVPSKKLKDVID